MKICFICHANICRSFMAQEFLKKALGESGLPGYEVISRGVYAQSSYAVPQKIKDFLAKEGIEYKGHESTLISKEDMDACGLILTMTAEQLDLLWDKYPQHSAKTALFMDYIYGLEQDVEDPIGLTGRAFEKTALKIRDAARELALKLKK